MSIEIHKPELERMVHEEVQRGHFGSVDELLTEALQALREKAAAHERARGLASHQDMSSLERQPNDRLPAPGLTQAQDISPAVSDSEPFWKGFVGKMHDLPNAVFERLPEDGASEHDHYLYESPKRNA